jgi:hypothetical protein
VPQDADNKSWALALKKMFATKKEIDQRFLREVGEKNEQHVELF